ncbi:MAG TPA: DUF4466 domain-containing protein [Chitinophagaceae bacterium]|jgi:hypothetical protein|nr:DUF4466 domain-containing protein [Chitinophagaceae bacterium]
MRNKNIKFPALILIMLTSLLACTKQEYTIPDPVSQLTNDCIKRTIGPSIVSLPLEFAYAMALPKINGKLVSAEVEASIAGASGTFLEHRSFYTNSSGVDVPVTIGTPSTTVDKLTKVTFNVDTNASTLRYNYVIPEEARGKSVSFTFTATSSDGKTATYKMGPYAISKMAIKKNLAVSNGVNAFISIEDMAVYNATAAATNAGKVDLVYLYRATPTTFTHALVSPGADAAYLPGVTLPSGVNRSTKLRKVFNLQDRNLSNLQYGIYVDDIDFTQLDMVDMPNYALGLRAEAGVWVETTDKKYRAYIFVNSINAAGTAVISILRYTL